MFSIASIPEQLQHEKQCQDICGDKPAGLLRSHHIMIEWPGERSDPKVVVRISALPNVNKHRRAKQRPEDSLHGGDRKQKMTQVLGVWVLSFAY